MRTQSFIATVIFSWQQHNILRMYGRVHIECDIRNWVLESVIHLAMKPFPFSLSPVVLYAKHSSTLPYTFCHDSYTNH